MYIQTQRLIIRDYRPADWQDLLEIFSDPLVMKHCEDTYDAEQTRSIGAPAIEQVPQGVFMRWMRLSEL